MIEFDKLRNNVVYRNQKECQLPKGDPKGFGEAVFLLSQSGYVGLERMTTSFMAYRKCGYKKYYADAYYKEKIGKKKIILNISNTITKDFEAKEEEFTSPLMNIKNSNKKSALKKSPNVLVNIGYWMGLFREYRQVTSSYIICDTFIRMLANRLNDPLFSNYNKTLYIDAAECTVFSLKLNFDKRGLNNPFTILLTTLYKYPELLDTYIGKVNILFVDSDYGMILKLSREDLIKKNYIKIKTRLLSFPSIRKNLESPDVYDTLEGEQNASKIVENPNGEISLRDKTPEEKRIATIMAKSSQEQNDIRNEKKKRVLLQLKKNLLGDVEDVTSYFDSEEEMVEDISTDNKKINEIEDDISKNLEENPEMLDMDETELLKQMTESIKEKYYKDSFTPTRTRKESNAMERLKKVQDKVFEEYVSFDALESKIIDEEDYTESVNTSNINILKSKFSAFDRSYNEKKLNRDIDDAIIALSETDNPVYVTEKHVEDSSDQLNLKETLTYKLEDIHGKKMTLQFDVPKIIDNNFVYLNGNKKVLEHQLILKPIVKHRKDQVQLVTALNKVFFTRLGVDYKTDAVFQYMNKNFNQFDIRVGNGSVMNKEITTSLEFDVFAKNIYSFSIDNNHFITDIAALLKKMKSLNIDVSKYENDPDILVVGYNSKTKTPITINKYKDSFTDKLIELMGEENEYELKKQYKRKPRLLYVKCKISGKEIPVILFLLYCIGLEQMMKEANIEYKIYYNSFKKEIKELDKFEWGITQFSDGVLAWKRYPIENSLLMNGFSKCATELYTIKDLQNKETYINMLTQFYGYANTVIKLDQFKDFLIDGVTREILEDFNLPTTVHGIFLYIVKLLKTNDFHGETDMRNMRIRSNEIISTYVYKHIANNYFEYRKTQYKKNPRKISLKGNEIINEIKAGSALIEEDSTMNPLAQLARISSVTYKGERGIGLDEAMTLDKRAYNESMLGILGITTSPDGNVGVSRQLTFEPAITSTRGYLDITGKKNVDELSSHNLFTAVELLTPFGVQHDDPARTAMSYKQSSHMIEIADADPVMIGNGVEKIIPYRLSSDFNVVAKEDGFVKDIKEGYVIVQYESGEYQSIDITKKVLKNGSEGFWSTNQLYCPLKKGDKFKKNEVIAWNDKLFKKNGDDLSTSMRLGALLKIAIIPEWDIYEDSAPVSPRASQKLSTKMVNPKDIVLNKEAHIYNMVNIGDKINTGDVLIKFDKTPNDPDTLEFMKALQALDDETHNEIIDSNTTTIKSKYTGTVVDIRIITTVPVEELSDSIRPYVEKYHQRIEKRENVLDKYKNPDDSKFFKSHQIIQESTEVVETDYMGKAGGTTIGEGIKITFFIEYEDSLARGDKLVAEFALKAVTSHVIESGYEAYSESDPDEPIDLIFAPLSVSARKTPSIFFAMFGNENLIFAKKKMKEYWENN